MAPLRALPLLVPFVVLAFACGSPSATTGASSTPSSGASAAVAPPSATASGSPSAPATASPSASVPAATPPAAPQVPGDIACGKATCRAPREVCCMGDAPRCVAAPPPNAEPLRYLGAVGEACHPGKVEAFAGYAGCDDTSDCKKGTRCCEQYVASGASSYLACSASCDISEACRETKSCSRPGAACLDGTCTIAPEKVRCGKTTCSAEAPYCCGDDRATATCGTDAACAEKRRFTCASSRECPEGHCQRGVMGNTYCTLLLDIANAAIVCERDADCPRDVCMGMPGKPRCDASDQACTCDTP